MNRVDIQEVRVVTGCDEKTARHYLACFNGNRIRTIENVIANGDDKRWWAHPWNSMTPEYVEDEMKTEDSERDGTAAKKCGPSVLAPSSGSISHAAKICDDSKERNKRRKSKASEPVIGLDVNLEDDRSFYGLFSYLVDTFVDSVCSGAKRNELRSLIAEADNAVILQTGERIRESDLANRLCYKHQTADGRSPLSYAVAMNLSQQVPHRPRCKSEQDYAAGGWQRRCRRFTPHEDCAGYCGHKPKERWY